MIWPDVVAFSPVAPPPINRQFRIDTPGMDVEMFPDVETKLDAPDPISVQFFTETPPPLKLFAPVSASRTQNDDAKCAMMQFSIVTAWL